MRQGLLSKDNIVNRSGWPNPYGGAWDGEPDFAQWRDTESGYFCRISPGGAYRTMEYAMSETERLAMQLRKVADEYVNPSLN